MKKISILLFVGCICTGLASCAPANITAVKWDSGVNGDQIETRCEQLDMRDNAAMDRIFTKYDGWKMIYASEYTTEHKIGTDACVCFQRKKPDSNAPSK